jgi:hypothetical protein
MLQFLQLSIQFTDTWIARGSKFTAILNQVMSLTRKKLLE